MHRFYLLLAALVLVPVIGQAQIRAQDGLAMADAGDFDGAVAVWRPLADKGDVLALFNLGVLAMQGQAGLTPAQAEGFFTKAAQDGHGPAQMALADLAVDQQDWKTAQEWYLAAAITGNARAQFMTGRILDDGLAGSADPAQAADWYERAALQNFAPAQLAFGRLALDNGDMNQGAVWLERAALAGMPEAQFDLAALLAGGLGLAQDLSAARAWYLRAAQSGNRNAMRNLALMQARGDGGAQSYLAALAWAMLANDAATDVAEALKEVMSPEAQAQASALAKTCLDMPVPPICE